MTARSWIVLGGGGHAKVVVDVLQRLEQNIIGYTDPIQKTHVLGVHCIGSDAEIEQYDPDVVYLANGLGSTRDTITRCQLYQRLTAKWFIFGTIVHPSAVVSQSVSLGSGIQIMAGSVIQTGCTLGNNVILNTCASIDHETTIGDHVHVAPGVTISGKVCIGAGAHIGVGAIVKQGVRIGENSTVGAGAVVLKDVPAGETVFGNPAKMRTQ